MRIAVLPFTHETVTFLTNDATRADLVANGVRPGDPFDAVVGGGTDPSAGEPWICVGFGAGNVLVLSPQLAQVVEPSELRGLGLAAEDFDVIALKSRAHFRRGFDDGGFARTILLVEPPEPHLGTVRLDGLAYETLRLTDFHPYGDPPDPVPGRQPT